MFRGKFDTCSLKVHVYIQQKLLTKAFLYKYRSKFPVEN